MLTGGDIGDRGISTGNTGVFLEIIQDGSTDFEVMRIARGLERRKTNSQIDWKRDVNGP